jgi:single-stranded DNA-binding protein
LAVVGHFKAVHQQEYYKPAETMWISVELWDDLAKSHYADIKKGHVLRGVGYLILNKWIDKLNGEERKMYKMRVTKLLSSEEFGTVNALLEDTVGATRSGTGVLVDDSDSAFASDHPALPDQSSDEHTRAELYGYRPRPPSVAVPPRPAAYPAKALTLGQDGRSAPSVSSSRSTAGPSQAGAEVWDLLDNAREGEYLPWWE